MGADTAEPAVRELRLEGARLIAALVLLLLAGGVCFELGRRFERGRQPLGAGSLSGGIERTLASEEDADLDATANRFDRAGKGSEREPAREVHSSTDTPTSTPAGEGGDFFVQVFAGRDLGAAEVLRRKLGDEGFPSALVTEREGSSPLYKVRVGGYPTRDRAREIADDLVRRGYSAWLPPNPS